MLEILYKSPSAVIVYKPPGIASQPDNSSKEDALTLTAELLVKQGEKSSLYPVHRLDLVVGGLLVIARTKNAAAELSAALSADGIGKEYLAVCHGVPQSKSDRLCDLLYYDRGRGKSFVVDKKRAGVRRAELEYTLKQSTSGLSLLAVKLFTGRTHQIRVQFASRKNPLCGDRRYGAPKGEASTPALLSHKLTFPHPTKHEVMTFVCEAPKAYPWNIFDI